MHTPIAAAALAAVLAAVPALAADNSAMADAAGRFYTAHLAVPASGGVPELKLLVKYTPFITPALNTLLIEGAAAETRYEKATKGQSPPLLEGDIFTSNFEGATTYKVGACAANGKTGQCKVELVYDDSKTNPKDKPARWTDTAFLVLTGQGWKIDDIGYGASWDFANKGKLSGQLKWADAESRRPVE